MIGNIIYVWMKINITHYKPDADTSPTYHVTFPRVYAFILCFTDANTKKLDYKMISDSQQISRSGRIQTSCQLWQSPPYPTLHPLIHGWSSGLVKPWILSYHQWHTSAYNCYLGFPHNVNCHGCTILLSSEL